MERKKNGALGGLSVEQHSAVERWLFDEVPALTYVEAQARVEAEFGVKVGKSSVGRFYQECVQRRMLGRVVDGGQAGDVAWGALGGNPQKACATLLEVVARKAFEVPVHESDLTLDELKDLAAVASLGIRGHAVGERLKLWKREMLVKEQMAKIWNRDVTLKERKYGDQLEKEGEPESKGGLSDETIEEIERRARLV